MANLSGWKRWWVWCKLNQSKKSHRILSQSWPWISWSITWITQWLSISSIELAVSSDMLSKYCKEIADKYEIKVGDVKN